MHPICSHLHHACSVAHLQPNVWCLLLRQEYRYSLQHLQCIPRPHHHYILQLLNCPFVVDFSSHYYILVLFVVSNMLTSFLLLHPLLDPPLLVQVLFCNVYKVVFIVCIITILCDFEIGRLFLIFHLTGWILVFSHRLHHLLYCCIVFLIYLYMIVFLIRIITIFCSFEIARFILDFSSH